MQVKEPKILWIHQMWLSIDGSQTPDKFIPVQKTWVDGIQKWNAQEKKNYKIEYRFWTWPEIRQLIQNHTHLHQYRHFLDLTIQEHIERCDFARYMVMSVYEGFYVDLDYALQDIHAWIQAQPSTPHLSLFLDHYDYDASSILGGLGQQNQHTVTNAILWSQGAREFWQDTLFSISQEYQSFRYVLETTGPLALTRSLHRWGDHRREWVTRIGTDLQSPRKLVHHNKLFPLRDTVVCVDENIDHDSHGSPPHWSKTKSNLGKMVCWMMRSFWDFLLACILLVGLLVYGCAVCFQPEQDIPREIFSNLSFQNPNL